MEDSNDYIPGDFTVSANDDTYKLKYNSQNQEATEALVHVYSLSYYDAVQYFILENGGEDTRALDISVVPVDAAEAELIDEYSFGND